MVFKQETGLSITAYVIKKRIEKAKQLLIERVLTLPEVAERVGFSDYNYFSRVFKKEVGVSPINYRKSF
jgi:two-component system response regulator YesN